MQKILKVDDKITLKQIKKEYASEIFRLVDLNRDFFKEWFFWVDYTNSITDVEDFISRCEHDFKTNGAYQWVIFEEDKIVGLLGQHEISKQNKKTSLGYWLSKDCNSKGIMTKSCARFIDFIFNEQNLFRICIQASTKNDRSFSVAERLGFKREGILRSVEWIREESIDHYSYSILKPEWKFNS